MTRTQRLRRHYRRVSHHYFGTEVPRRIRRERVARIEHSKGRDS